MHELNQRMLICLLTVLRDMVGNDGAVQSAQFLLMEDSGAVGG